MADKTPIEWADASWNPVTGCDEVSPGCANCYAKTLAERFRGVPGHYFERGFDVVLRPDKLDLPLRWTRPRKVFVNSMSDLFHEKVPDDYIAHVFAVMSLARQHTFQVLTKRHGRMRSLLRSPDFARQVEVAKVGTGWRHAEPWWPLPNVWLGVSVEDQHWADIRIPALLDTRAAVRWISAEPLLGPVDLSGFLRSEGDCPTCGGLGSVLVPGGGAACPRCNFDLRAVKGPPLLDWVVVGGESGRGARPMHPQWARELRDQCVAAGVPFFMKQAGEVLARQWGLASRKGHDPAEWPEPFPREYPSA